MENLSTLLFIFVVIGIVVGYFTNSIVRSVMEEERSKGVIRLSRKKDTEPLKIEIEGKKIDAESGPNKEQLALLQNVMLDLNLWLGNSTNSEQNASTRPGGPEIAPLPFSLPSPILFTPSGSDQAIPVEAIPPASTPKTTAPRPQANQPPNTPEKPLKFSMSPVNMIQNIVEVDKSKQPINQQSIITQVNDILQNKMLGTPFEKRGIRLLEKPDHTMLIEIGLNKYDGIDAIPSEDIRDLIRSCVDEWSARSG